MNEFERKFIVDSEGNAEEKAMTEEEKLRIAESKKKKTLFRHPDLEKSENKKFEVDENGNIRELGK